MFSTLLTLLDALGLIAFAITGALAASRQQMGITGFVLLAVATGVGGGTLRDLVLGLTAVRRALIPDLLQPSQTIST